MGNSDLIIIINNWSFFILGKNYENRFDAIRKAIEKFEKDYEELLKVAEKPEEISGGIEEIKEIKIYEIDLNNYE
jgi:hypothetical protein